MNSSNHLGLFAKFWDPGNVKTRLAAALGEPRAANVYLHFLTHLLKQLAAAGDHRQLVYQPADRKPQFSKLSGPQWQLTPQVNGPLDSKLKAFFSDLFETPLLPQVGNRKVVVIGSDCPLIDASLIDEAFRQLDDCPVVIGPSADGGYYLIGMRENKPWLFDGISWSTDRVLEQTIGNLEARQIRFRMLSEMNDIDHWDDLKTLLDELRSRPVSCPDRPLLDSLELAMAGFETLTAPVPQRDHSS